MCFFSKECYVHKAEEWFWRVSVAIGQFFDHILIFFFCFNGCDPFIPGKFFCFAFDVSFRYIGIDGQINGCGKGIDFLLFAFHC